MCLIFLAWRHRADFPLIVAANRDEFYGRPTAPAAYWDDAPGLLAGRDLEAGGTWLGVTRTGRFAALTNYRSAANPIAGGPTRGRLVSDFLSSDRPAGAYVSDLATVADRYNGFNLLVGDGESLHWISNRGGAPTALAPGIYGVSNELLDTPWPKVVNGKNRFEILVNREEPDAGELLDLLMDREIADDGSLPDTGVGLTRERALSPMFIDTEHYGTRCSTVVLERADARVEFHERTHPRGTSEAGTLTYAHTIEAGVASA